MVGLRKPHMPSVLNWYIINKADLKDFHATCVVVSINCNKLLF